MNLGKKLAYFDQHVESILRHDDESVDVRRHFAAEMRKKIDEEVAAMEARDAARIETLMADRVNPVEAAASQVAEVEETAAVDRMVEAAEEPRPANKRK